MIIFVLSKNVNVMDAKKEVDKIFEKYNNKEISDKIGESYSYAAYIRHRNSVTGLTDGVTKKLLKGFGYTFIEVLTRED